ncbi:DUF1839 family protein [Pendulispora albinea]|uniref:DUF1839 family protein n=1 Tax=Pendulispora albinea TaxID=2741071 RepID=A0ABZ2M6Y5_9BACT
MSRAAVLPHLDPATYQKHTLHADDRVWIEKNCYVDIWVELLHALGLEPRAVLPFALAIDFEGDQWTFFKPPHGELFDLYGVDVQELNPWRPLVEHAVTQLGAGKLISMEADAFWLPDTSGTDYRRQHTKTTIILADIDVERGKLGYFHNAGYHALEGEDFARLFRIGAAPDPTFMPLFVELVRIDRMVRRPRAELVAMSRALLAKHLARRPSDNPVIRFGQAFERELPRMQSEGLAFYHAWAFATVRQLGAAFELAAAYVRWLEGDGSRAGDDPPNDAPGAPALGAAAEAFDSISVAAKAFILKAARAVNGKRAFDAATPMAEMADAWQRGMDVLERYARHVSVSAP